MNLRLWILALIVLLFVSAACAPTQPASNSNFSQSAGSVPSATPGPQPTRPPVTSGSTPTEICAANVPAANPSNRTYSAAEQVLQPGVDYRAVMCTEVGPVYLDLFENLTPVTVNSFVFLADRGYYNNTTFHRVLANFMAQGGDPTGTGTGGPGYQFQEEFVGFLHFDRPGFLAMARTNQPGTNGSQFFITTAVADYLDYQYTIFGEVLEGQENVNRIRLRDPETDPSPGTGLQTVIIITDPAAVATTYVEPASATAEQIAAALMLADDDLPVDAGVELTVSSVLSAAEIVAGAPEGIREAYETFLSSHSHEFRVSSALLNPTCNMDTAGFMNASYTIDAFATAADASAARADSFLPTLASALGYPTAVTSTETNYGTYYTGTTNACNRSATQGMAFWTYGRYLITATITIPADSTATADVWFARLISILYDRALSDVFRAEIR